MEIHSLKIVVTQDDLNLLMARFLNLPPKLCNLSIELIPNGLLLSGIYETILSVPFKCLWKLSVGDGKLQAELADIKCVGVRLNLLKPYVLNALVANCKILELRDEGVFLDLDRLLAQMIVPVRANLTSVHCEARELVIECSKNH